MKHARGFMELVDNDLKVEVAAYDTMTCQHCNSVEVIPPYSTINLTWCKKCMGLVCKRCAAKPCDPVERKLERQEAMGRELEKSIKFQEERERVLRSYGLR